MNGHLQEAWLSFMSLASCSVFSSAGAEPSQICLNSGTRSFSLYTCSARCRSRKPTATPHIASAPALHETIVLNRCFIPMLPRYQFTNLGQGALAPCHYVRYCKQDWGGSWARPLFIATMAKEKRQSYVCSCGPHLGKVSLISYWEVRQ